MMKVFKHWCPPGLFWFGSWHLRKENFSPKLPLRPGGLIWSRILDPQMGVWAVVAIAVSNRPGRFSEHSKDCLCPRGCRVAPGVPVRLCTESFGELLVFSPRFCKPHLCPFSYVTLTVSDAVDMPVLSFSFVEVISLLQ